MNDRVPTYPGRVKLTEVGTGEVKLFDMEMADEPKVAGDPPTKGNLLQDATCAILDIPRESVPNDAFCKLALGIGKYGYAISVRLWDGTPVHGAVVSGILTPDGQTPITNEQGDAVGVSTEQSVVVNITSPWIDAKSVSDVIIQSTGILTAHVQTLEKIDIPLITVSGIYKLSPRVKTFDLCAVGGGSSSDTSYDYGLRDASNGGCGGFAVNALGFDASVYHHEISVSIGAGGRAQTGNSQPANSGGKTTVSANGNVLVSANGASGAGSTGNGNGLGGNAILSYESGDDRSIANGKDATVYLFNEISLGLAGGGGGSGGISTDEVSGFRTQATPGKPNGGKGGLLNYTNSASLIKLAGTSGIAPGGGGGGGAQDGSGRSHAGGDGGVYVRCHYN